MKGHSLKLRSLKPFVAAGVLGVALLFGPAARSQEAREAAPQPGADPLEQVEVLGERPGPQMWKVSKGDHILWVLGTLQPLPKGMKWRSKPVEDVIAQSQEVISGGVSVDADIGPITAIRLYRQWRRVRNNANGATLKEVLPEGLHTRFAALKAKYAPRDESLERLQPMFAGGRLVEEAIRATKLASDTVVQKTVFKIAKRHKVKVRRIQVEVEDPRGLLGVVGETPLAAQLICLDTTLARMETDLNTIAARAEAWAVGDVDALRELPYVDQDAACWTAISAAPQIKELVERARIAWITAVEAALEKNHSTLAMQGIERLLGKDGLLAMFAAKGYTVEGP